MTGYEKAERLLFKAEEELFVPFRNFRQLPSLAVAVPLDYLRAPEQGNLGALPLLLSTLSQHHRVFQRGHKRRPFRPGRVEGAAFHQRFHHPLVHPAQVDPLAEIENVAEVTLLTGVDDRLDGPLTYILDRPEAEPDGVSEDAERAVGCVDVGRQHLDTHVPAVARCS